MGVADNLDQLRADAWLLARRTRRLGRRLQGQIVDISDRLPGRTDTVAKQVSRGARRLRRQVVARLPETISLSAVAGLVRPRRTLVARLLDRGRDLFQAIADGIVAVTANRQSRVTDRLRRRLSRIRGRRTSAIADLWENANLSERLADLGSQMAEIAGRLAVGERLGSVVERAGSGLAHVAPRLGEGLEDIGDRLEAFGGRVRQRALIPAAEAVTDVIDSGVLRSLLRRVPQLVKGASEDVDDLVDSRQVRTLLKRGRQVGEAVSDETDVAVKAVRGLDVRGGLRWLFGGSRRARRNPVAWWVGFGLAAGLGAMWMVNRRIRNGLRHVEAPSGAMIGRYPTAFGEMAYRVAGQGTPLVLIHGLGPGASHHVWDRNIDELAKHFKVYAVDLLGFGLSDKPAITYTGDRFSRVIAEFLRDVVGEPAVVVAASLPATFAARALAHHPELASELVLVNPVGEIRRTVGRRLISALTRVPILDSSLYFGMTRRSTIADRLRSQYFVDPGAATDSLIEQFHANARQPGADRAIRDMIGGRMDLDLATELAHLEVPLSILWGRHAVTPPVSEAHGLMNVKPNATLSVFENSAMFPQADEADNFNQFLIGRFAHQAAGTSGQSAGA